MSVRQTCYHASSSFPENQCIDFSTFFCNNHLNGYIMLADVALGIPEFSLLATIENSQLVCLLPAGVLNLVMFIQRATRTHGDQGDAI